MNEATNKRQKDTRTLHVFFSVKVEAYTKKILSIITSKTSDDDNSTWKRYVLESAIAVHCLFTRLFIIQRTTFKLETSQCSVRFDGSKQGPFATTFVAAHLERVNA